MAYIFGDGFDCYATAQDAVSGYWDSGTISNLVVGRFAGSQAMSVNGVSTGVLVKSSGVNDAVHHIVCATYYPNTLVGSTIIAYFQLSDAATNQVCICFRSDGAILLTSATSGGTVLATYSGAVTAQATWTAFEFEVVIHPTAGRFRARKNGNTVDDFDSGATLNTRPGANSYANKLSLGCGVGGQLQRIDDVLWRSDASSVPFVGDIRCYTRMPASDASVQFARSPALSNVASTTLATSSAYSAGQAPHTPITATFSGTIGSATVNLANSFTGNMKCSLFASSGGNPTTILGSATSINNPIAGINTFTFSTPIPVTAGTQYWLGFCADAACNYSIGTGSLTKYNSPSYATFPVASPGGLSTTTTGTCNLIITLTANFDHVNETLQDGNASYVYDSTVGHADFYNLAPLAVTPASVVAVTTRGFTCKSDAGTRGAAMQLKSGGTTVASTATLLSSSFGWLWRSDLTDPATGSAWTAVGVNGVQIGPQVTS